MDTSSQKQNPSTQLDRPEATAAGGAVGPTRRRYTAPRLMEIGTVDEMLGALGPAQANYGTTGFG